MMPSNTQTIADIGEKNLIKRIQAKAQVPKSTFFNSFFNDKSLKSLDDDAALLDIGEQYLVITSDMVLESSHLPKQMSPWEIGRKSVIVNISDLAAMGARPLGMIMCMGLPPDLLLDDFDGILEGILSGCKAYDIALIGGDTNESSEITLCGTAIGLVDKDKVLMKNGAKNSDVLAVTGHLGMAAAGFEILFQDIQQSAELDDEDKQDAIKSALRPEARVKEGIILSESGSVTSATDISDGLVSEMGEIINANHSSIGICFKENLIPTSTITKEISEIIYNNPLELPLYYGEDFELLVTVRKEEYGSLKEKIDLHEIGFITSSGKIEIVDNEGKINILAPRGYEHLKKP